MDCHRDAPGSSPHQSCAEAFYSKSAVPWKNAVARSTVIKSLDHWPDLGSDLDLYTDADATHVVNIMRACFSARLADRSWGDRLANKWNFVMPGLPELVEVHAGRLGQTGEQTTVTRSRIGAHPNDPGWGPLLPRACARRPDRHQHPATHVPPFLHPPVRHRRQRAATRPAPG